VLKIKSILYVFLNQGSHKVILRCFPTVGLGFQRRISSVAPVLHRTTTLISVTEKKLTRSSDPRGFWTKIFPQTFWSKPNPFFNSLCHILSPWLHRPKFILIYLVEKRDV